MVKSSAPLSQTIARLQNALGFYERRHTACGRIRPLPGGFGGTERPAGGPGGSKKKPACGCNHKRAKEAQLGESQC